MFKKPFICIFIFFFFLNFKSQAFDSHYHAYLSQELPYEPCNWSNAPYTSLLEENVSTFSYELEQNLADANLAGLIEEEEQNDSSAWEIHQTCFLASAARGVHIWTPNQGNRRDSNYYYCRSSEEQSEPLTPIISEAHMFVVDDEGKERWIFPRSFCLNEDYISMTKLAFHQMARCFDLTPEDLKQFFALYNHESAFLLNKRSSTGAACYGQLTQSAISYVNQMIFFKDSGEERWQSNIQIYRDAIAKCPILSEKVAPSRIVHETKRTSSNFKNIMKEFSFDESKCLMTHDPYFCLFYSIYTVKINLIQSQAWLDKDSPSYSGSIDKKTRNRIERDFSLPIKNNQVLIVKGTVTKEVNRSPETRTVSWIFKDDHEAIETLKKHNYELNHLYIQKLTLFDDSDIFPIRWALTHWMYNGGRRGIKRIFDRFIQDFKNQIASPCPLSSSNEELCSYRKTLLEEAQPLNFRVFENHFKSYIQTNYRSGSQRRINEVAHFLEKMTAHMQYFQNSDALLQRYLQEILFPDEEDFDRHERAQNEVLFELTNFVQNSCHLGFFDS